jgi:protein SCO1
MHTRRIQSMIHVVVGPRPLLMRVMRAALLTLVLSLCVLQGCTRWSGTRLDGHPAADVGALRIAQHRDQVVLLTFGFTSCPDVCPLTLSRMKAAYRALGADADRVAMAFVTVDPDRDRPDVLGAHVAAFDRRILPVFVEGRALADALAAYGATATKRITDPDRYHRVGAGAAAAAPYTVDHTSGFFVVDKRGRLRLHEAHDVAADALAADVRRLLAEKVPPPVRVEQAVARLTPSGVGAIYFRIVNPAGDGDRLLSAESRAAERTEIHESVTDGDVVRMIAPERGFAVPPHATVELARGGKHLMLLGLSQRDPTKPIPLTLRFERSGAIAVDVPVEGGS